MNRRIGILAGLLIVLTLGIGGCAKKAQPAAAGARGAGAAEAAVPEGAEGDIDAAARAGRLSLPVVHFDFNMAVIRSADRPLLKEAAESLKKTSGTQVTIEGHCDERGSVEYNLALGERRAQAVKSYLTKLGVEGKRLGTISYGEERPADSGHNEDAWAKNRRAEMVVNR